jgi:hypothetical protein
VTGAQQPANLLGRTLDSIPPAVGAEVMGTGSVSVGLSADGQEMLSRVLLAIAAARWLLIATLVPFGLGLGLYVSVIARFDFHQLVLGRGDHWITGGAVAISALAAGKIVANALGILRGGALEDIAIGLWVWIGLASRAIVSVATIGRAVGVVRGRGSPYAGTPAPTT